MITDDRNVTMVGYEPCMTTSFIRFNNSSLWDFCNSSMRRNVSLISTAL